MLRWRIAILVSAAIALSDFDRQILPIAIKAIEREIPVSNQNFSDLQSGRDLRKLVKLFVNENSLIADDGFRA